MNQKKILIMALIFMLISAASFTKSRAEAEDAEAPEAAYTAEDQFMQMAIDEARDGIYNGDGGPFGCVIIKDSEVIGKGHNCVLKYNDSTWHGEIGAIRDAEAYLESYDLSGAVLYTTGEPCMMCLAACLWANIDHVYYGCTIEDNSVIGFRDQAFDDLLNGSRENLKDYLEEMDRDTCLQLFNEYNNMNKTIY